METFKKHYIVIMSYFYLGQGFSLGSLVLLLPIYMLDVLHIGSEGRVATISVLLIFPWYLKVIWGFISDRYEVGRFGRRKPYLVLATLLGLFGWLSLGWYSSVNVGFIFSVISLSFGSAFADSVLDAQAVEITPEEFIGRMQGTAWGARGIGLGLAGYVSTTLVDLYGWAIMFNVVAFFGISITLLALLLPQNPLYVHKVLTMKELLSQVFKLSLVRTRVAYFITSGMVLGAIPLLSYIMKFDFAFSLKQIGIGSLVFALMNGLGSLTMGFLFDNKETIRRILLMNLIMLITFLFGGILSVFEFLRINYIVAIAFLSLFGFALGIFEAYQLKVIQESSNPVVEGTAFSFWTSISNIGEFVFGALVLANLADYFQLPFTGVILLIIIPLFLTHYYISKIKIA